MHLIVFLKRKKTLKHSILGKKNPKKTKKTKKNHWAGFFFKKTGFFPTLPEGVGRVRLDAQRAAGHAFHPSRSPYRLRQGKEYYLNSHQVIRIWSELNC
jgi:hypothetical protein